MSAQEYKLSCNLGAHSSDVRAIAITENGDILTASIDKTTRLWSKQASETGNTYVEKITYIGHSGSVTCVCNATNNDLHKDGLTITGSRDTTIKVFPRDLGDPIRTLTGHTDSVSCLSWDENGQFLASGSWDHSARVWHNWECLHILKGHEGPVWAVTFVNSNNEKGSPPKLLTASADKTIKLWIKNEVKTTYKGHTDCVRGLAILDDERFISCSNDAAIKLWNFSGNCLESFYGHSSFIYSVAVNKSNHSFISGGEDRTLRVWDSNGSCTQTIHVPTQSVWCVASLPNGDIVAGSSDGICRIFTLSSERYANEEEIKEFTEKVAKSTVAIDLGGVNKSEIPGKDALHNPGKKDGQTKMIREGDKIFCYSWSAAKFQWEAVGEVVGGAGGSANTSGKVLYQGREYDYVFDVDIDGENILKLPYNNSEDPWHVAQAFIHKNELPQSYLDEVAKFIITNANVSVSSNELSSYQDPFTGGARYVPGSRSNTTSAGGDPFTSSSRYVPPQANNPSSSKKSNYFPQLTPLKFEACNAEGILNKFKEFNGKVSEKLNESQLETIVQCAVDVDSNPDALSPLEIALQWTPDCVWPALDVLRLALRSKKVHESWIKNTKGESLLSLIVSLISAKYPAPTQLLALRCISNFSAHPPGREVLLNCRDAVVSSTVTISPFLNKNIEIAASTILLNYSVILPCQCSAENLVQVISAISTIALVAKDPEAQFRSLVALGTLLSKVDEEGKALANSLDLESIVKNLALVNDPLKVGECARHVLNVLS